MAISYPLTPPSSPKPSEVIFFEENQVAISESPYTFNQQVQEHAATRWRLSVQIDPLSRAESAPWFAFLTALRGKRGTFTFGSTLRALPLGTPLGTPLVNGANQTGFTLATDGWTINKTNLLKAGDFIQIGTALYKVVANVNSNGSGQANIELWPRLRVHANDAPIITSNAVGLFRLTEEHRELESRNQLYPIYFTAIEAL